ncbi:hypothetical protein Hanom_Chr15g01344671 [Helianthus anomalus]
MGEITIRFPCSKKLSSSTRLIIRDSQLFCVSDRMGRELTAADVSIVAAGIIFSRLEEASLSEHGSSIAPKTL